MELEGNDLIIFYKLHQQFDQQLDSNLNVVLWQVNNHLKMFKFTPQSKT